MNEITYVGKHLVTYSVSEHSHDTWELIYCTEGHGKFIFDGNTPLEYAKHDIVIIPPKLSHTNSSKDGFTNIHINLENATFPFKNAVLIEDDSEGHIFRAFDDAFFYFNSQQDKKKLIISALGNLIVNYIITFQTSKPISKTVEIIKADIVKNFPDCNYSLEDFMRSLPYSYDYLRKLFKSELGVTPHNFLTEMRMQTAEKLLSLPDNGDYSVGTVAQMCGFSEPLYFSRVFKKNFGVSPAHYAAAQANK